MPPNKNCFLQVDVDPGVLDWAHGLAMKAQALAQAEGFDFEPVERHGLHMTLVFFGEAFHSLKADARTQLMDVVGKLLRGGGSGFATLSPVAVEPFPPGKFNLLILRFDGAAQPLLQNLHGSIVAAAAKLSACDADRNGSPWVPHITLGKFRCDAANVVRLGRAVAAALTADVSQMLRLDAEATQAMPVFAGSLSVNGAPGHTVTA